MRIVRSDHPPGGVCVITADLTRYARSMRCLSDVKVPPGSARHWGEGTLVSANVNKAFRKVMENPDLQWAWLMGDDHTFSPDILVNLLDRDKDVVVPLCLNRMVPMDPTIVVDGKRLKYLEEVPVGGLYKLADNETCGDAGMLIRRHVLQDIGEPWYENKLSGTLGGGEDQDFIRRVKGAGFEVYVDTDNRIGHIAPVAFDVVDVDGHFEVGLSVAGRPFAALGQQQRAS